MSRTTPGQAQKHKKVSVFFEGVAGGRRGFTHDSPRTPNVHISGPWRFEHHQNSTKGPQERERRKKIVAGGGKKKARNFGPPTLRGSTLLGSTLLGSTLRGPTLRGPTFSLGHPSGPHPSRAPHFVVPKFNIQKLAEVEICRSRNLQKSKLAEIELAELENKRWPKSKLAEVDRAPHLISSCVFKNVQAFGETMTAIPQIPKRNITKSVTTEEGKHEMWMWCVSWPKCGAETQTMGPRTRARRVFFSPAPFSLFCLLLGVFL